jgi:hypothetical protein
MLKWNGIGVVDFHLTMDSVTNPELCHPTHTWPNAESGLILIEKGRLKVLGHNDESGRWTTGLVVCVRVCVCVCGGGGVICTINFSL